MQGRFARPCEINFRHKNKTPSSLHDTPSLKRVGVYGAVLLSKKKRSLVAALCRDDTIRKDLSFRAKGEISQKESKDKIINNRYMKKTYVSPLMVEVNVQAESMLAASLKINNEKTVDTSNGGQLSGGSRGEWGNLWN